MAPIAQDQPQRKSKPKPTVNAPIIPKLADKLATPQFLVPPGTEPGLPGAAFGHQFGFRPPVAVDQHVHSSNIDPRLLSEDGAADGDMEAEQALDSGANDDGVSVDDDGCTLADRKKDADGGGDTEEEEEAIGFDQDEVSNLEGKFMFHEISPSIDMYGEIR